MQLKRQDQSVLNMQNTMLEAVWTKATARAVEALYLTGDAYVQH